jgi:type II secretory pathway pseudopilin PulG
MKVNSQTRRNPAKRNESGYIMLTLLLAMALMVMFAAIIVPSITFDIRRDREEEMIHRGVQYSRAIRAYYKKFGRYPTKIEDLESANNLRFLRKRYKDPLNCKNGKCEDFKLLHFGEAKLSMTGGMIPGANPAASTGGLNGATGLNQTSPMGNTPGFGASNAPQQPGQQTGTADSTQTGSQPTDATGTNSSESNSNNLNGNAGDKLSNTTFGGGPIVGVASAVKKDTIREFNHKKKYNEWQFVYDPAQDQGRLITTPYQPQLTAFGQQGMQNVNGQNGSSSGTGTGFGTSNGLGTSPTGMQNNPSAPQNPGYGAPNPPSSPPDK